MNSGIGSPGLGAFSPAPEARSAIDHALDGVGKIRVECAHLIGEGLQPAGERRVEVATPLGRLL